MGEVADGVSTRLPRFRRAPVPPAFRLTAGDLDIIRQIARYRLIRSTDIATLVGRSPDRTNDRLKFLFHAGYLDRPRAQLDRFPADGTGRMVYGLADLGARLLRDRDGVVIPNPELSRKNRRARRPFIEHQAEIANFQAALHSAVREQPDLALIDELALRAEAPRQLSSRAPFAFHARLSDRGIVREAPAVPDLAFGLGLPKGARRNFVAEIDRGTMPVRRSDPRQTSFERKMRVYLAAHGTRFHERQFGWKNFRVLVVTTTADRIRNMHQALRNLRLSRGCSAALFLFTTFQELQAVSPLTVQWRDGTGGGVSLL
jgi:hypothetical protein